MQSENRILELFEPPMSLGEVTRCAVATIERDWAHLELHVIYFCLKILFNKKVSNSHSAPFGKPTNWGNKSTHVATGYPGWSGRIWVGISKSYPTNGMHHNPSNPLRRIGIHTGTGGGGTYDLPTFLADKLAPDRNLRDYCDPWGWDVKMFLDDFPSLKMLKMFKQL
jgi:hypothetical protein